MITELKRVSDIYPKGRFILPEPEAHSGHLRLQILVSSIPKLNGIPQTTGDLVIVDITHEEEILIRFIYFNTCTNRAYLKIIGGKYSQYNIG